MPEANEVNKTVQQIRDIFKRSGLKGKDLKSALREVVRQEWPDLPSWSTLDAPLIEEVQKASLGSGVALVFEENGVKKALLARAGGHYNPTEDSFMIPGGFINLSHTIGSTLVPASKAPEDAAVGAAREIEEELKKIDGSPLLIADPARLKPMDTKTLAIRTIDRSVVIGFMMELNADEIATVKEHMQKIEADPAYAQAASLQSMNHDSNKPEVDGLGIFDLKDVAEGKCNLLHKDQLSLFQAVHQHYVDIATPKRRQTQTRAYQDKVKTLPELEELAKTWREQGNGSLGVTSGVFDILHPGHISFLEDANTHADKVVVIIASDRTVREQKGDEKPYITAQRRAQTIATLETVDAVIISDEPYHETILKALKPDVMFKGDDYAGKTIIGAELVGKTVLIPCAEKEFYSSSAFVNKIKNAGPG